MQWRSKFARADFSGKRLIRRDTDTGVNKLRRGIRKLLSSIRISLAVCLPRLIVDLSIDVAQTTVRARRAS